MFVVVSRLLSKEYFERLEVPALRARERSGRSIRYVVEGGGCVFLSREEAQSWIDRNRNYLNQYNDAGMEFEVAEINLNG